MGYVRSLIFMGCLVAACILSACGTFPAHTQFSPSPTTSAPSTSFSLTTTTETPGPPIFGATPSSPAAFFGLPVGAACAPGDLALAWGGQVSEATGQHSLGLVLTNTSNVTCHLIGYPGISLIDSGGTALPLAYRRGGDQMVTSSTPENVNLPPRSAAYVLINQYRCDLGDKDTAAILRFIPPNTTSSLELRFDQIDSSVMAYCGPADPGSIIDISPVEPTARATFALEPSAA